MHNIGVMIFHLFCLVGGCLVCLGSPVGAVELGKYEPIDFSEILGNASARPRERTDPSGTERGE